MYALDDVGWEHGFSFSSYGVELGVRATDVEILVYLQGHLPLYSKGSSAGVVERLFSVLTVTDTKSRASRYNLYWDQMLFAKNVSLEDLQDKFSAVASLAVAELSDEKLFIHCGVVEWKGKAILLPGRSHCGKSSLVAELVKSGARYYSDEFAVIDNEGYVSAYPKPISLRDPVTKIQRDVAIEDIGGKTGSKRLPVGLVLVTQYKAGARWKPEELSPGRGLLHLLDNTHSAQRAPEQAMRTLKRVAEGARIISSPRGEASETVHKLLTEMNFVL